MGYYIILGLLVVGLVLYGAFLYYRGKQMQEIEAIDEKKVAVFDIPVDSVILTLKKMHLSGKTKRLYESWAHRWDNLLAEQLPNIEAELDDAVRLVEQMLLWKSKKSIQKAKGLVDEAEEMAFQIDETLQRIVDSETSNHEEIEGIRKKYEDLRNAILTDSHLYQDAFITLESRLKDIEGYLEQFTTLMEEADYLEARDVLKDVERATETIESKLEAIPQLYAELNDEYADQAKDLQEGYTRLVEEKFQFSQTNLQRDIEELDIAIESAIKDVTSLELEAAHEKKSHIQKEIDRLYDVMEAEIAAKDYITRVQLGLEGRIKQIAGRNHHILVEIDRVSQHYELTDNETERLAEFKEELEKEEESMEHYRTQLDNHDIVYTLAKAYFEKLEATLLTIDQQQTDILESVTGLRQRERDARDQLDLFESDLRTMKRSLEKQHLPGIDKGYLDLFFATTKRIETLSEKLNRIKVNMKEVDEYIATCLEDIEHLDEETENIIDSALLTESLIQYANRYRMEYAKVEKAINVAINLYSRQYKYAQARQTVAEVLNDVERGSVQRVERLYFEDKNRKMF